MNETLFVSLDFQTDKLNNSVVWEYNQPTPEWTEGQVELRSEMVDDKYVDWQITVMGVKPGNMKAFIAVDDFGFRSTDICEIMPPTTTSPPITTSSQTPTSTKSTSTSTKPTKPSTTRTTSDWVPPGTTTTQTDDIATAVPGDSHSETALIVGLVVGVVVLLALVAVSVITVRKRNIKLPTVASVRGLINPGYSKLDDGGMVGLKYFQQRIFMFLLSSG